MEVMTSASGGELSEATTSPTTIQLRCGSVEITPRNPMILAGCDIRDLQTPHSRVDDPLLAQVFVIESKTIRSLIVTIDLLYSGVEIVRACENAAEQNFPGVDVMVFASHTHSATATDRSKPLLGASDPVEVDRIAKLLVSLIQELSHVEPTECYAIYRAEQADLAVNRRIPRVLALDGKRPRLRTVVQGANERGPVDDVLAIVSFQSVIDNRTVGVLANFACHPVGYPHRRTVSAHFPSVIREALKSEVIQGEANGDRESASPIVGFIQGFSGDNRPKSASTCRAQRTGWRRLLAGPGLSAFEAEDYSVWISKVKDSCRRVMSAPPVPVIGKETSHSCRTVERRKVLVGSAFSAPLEVKVLRLGSFLLLGISGEVVTQYAQRLREALSDYRVFLAGCMGDVVGYIPTESMLRRGGYEAHGFCKAFSAQTVPRGVEHAVEHAAFTALAEVGVVAVPADS